MPSWLRCWLGPDRLGLWVAFIFEVPVDRDGTSGEWDSCANDVVFMLPFWQQVALVLFARRRTALSSGKGYLRAGLEKREHLPEFSQILSIFWAGARPGFGKPHFRSGDIVVRWCLAPACPLVSHQWLLVAPSRLTDALLSIEEGWLDPIRRRASSVLSGEVGRTGTGGYSGLLPVR